MSLPSSSPPPSSNKKIRRVISCLLQHNQKILILKRSKKVGSFQGYWSCISGYLEKGEDPKETAYREIGEETSKESSTISCIQSAGPFYSEVPEVIFESYWFLFKCEDPKVKLDWEHDHHLWISPQQVKKYRTVPWFETMIKTLAPNDAQGRSSEEEASRN
jgi:8-oxo-dGTP pyrophosphatase MutT (NUDIX family)